MLPRWFRVLLVADLALVAAVAVLGARLALDGAHNAGRAVTWARPGMGAAPPPPASAAPSPLAAPPTAAQAVPGHPPLAPALLHRLDSDTASSANAERGLLGLLEEAIRRRIVDILERVQGSGQRDRGDPGSRR